MSHVKADINPTVPFEEPYFLKIEPIHQYGLFSRAIYCTNTIFVCKDEYLNLLSHFTRVLKEVNIKFRMERLDGVLYV